MPLFKNLFGRLISVTILTVGSGTYVVPAGINSILVEMIGGGGGGGGADGGSSESGVGGGGAAAGYLRKFLSSLNASYAYVVGVGGVGGLAGNNAGTAGGESTFGTALLNCNGGGGGASMVAGTSFAATGAGSGGTASGGDFNMTGSNGPRSFRFS